MDDRDSRNPVSGDFHWDDFAIILLLLVTNAVVGFFQEKAENAIELLKKQLAPNARVLRDGTWQEIPPVNSCPVIGSIFASGTSSRQMRYWEAGRYLLLDESALTGESLRREENRRHVCYSRVHCPPG